MTNDEIRARLFSLQDSAYREFQSKLIPNVPAESVIGVRTPELRRLAKEIFKSGDFEGFLSSLPHKYFEENQLHAFIISEIKDFEKCLSETEKFLPFVDNWATCDQSSFKAFNNHKAELQKKIKVWIKSNHTYTVRFAIGKLMQLFLDEDFRPEYAELVASVKSEEYYVNMMIAWYFATALSKQYEAAFSFIEQKRLDKWTHNKTIQKACESFRISDERKEILRGYKI